jgi:hypothetical protein
MPGIDEENVNRKTKKIRVICAPLYVKKTTKILLTFVKLCAIIIREVSDVLL